MHSSWQCVAVIFINTEKCLLLFRHLVFHLCIYRTQLIRYFVQKSVNRPVIIKDLRMLLYIIKILISALLSLVKGFDSLDTFSLIVWGSYCTVYEIGLDSISLFHAGSLYQGKMKMNLATDIINLSFSTLLSKATYRH